MPPSNLDTERKIAQESKVPIHFKYQKWTKAEQKSLSNAVETQNKQILFFQFMEEYVYYHFRFM